MSFHVPAGWENFYNTIKKNFLSLIESQVITGISQTEFRLWVKNFETAEEQYLAAHLIDALIFRTSDMIKSMSYHVIETVLPKALEKINEFPSSDLDEFIKSLRKPPKKFPIKFTPVGGAFLGSGKSGDALIREFRKAVDLQKNLIVSPDVIAEIQDTKVVVFIDDMLGTGAQFDEFCTHYNIDNINDIKFIYIPFVAHVDGVGFIQGKHKNVLVCPVEILTKENQFFEETEPSSGIWFRDRENNIEDVKYMYRKILHRHDVNVDNIEGVGKKSLTVLLSISAPNNTLKAYYSNEGSWKRLVTR